MIKRIGLLIVAITTTSAVVLDHALSKELGGMSKYLAVLIVAVSGILVEHVSDSLIRERRWVRNVISGEDYVEGTWVDVYPAKDTEAHVGVVTICFRDNEIFLSGVTYIIEPEKFVERGNWKSLGSKYDSDSLLYLYRENVFGRFALGAGRLDFHRLLGCPVRYHSLIFDRIHTSEMIGYGYKVSDPSEIEAIKKGSSELRSVLDRYRKLHVDNDLSNSS